MQALSDTVHTDKETKVGLTVGRLRSNESPEVSELAKEIVKKWKSDVDDEKKRKSTSFTYCHLLEKTHRVLHSG
jgi:transcription elongation factor S-II